MYTPVKDRLNGQMVWALDSQTTDPVSSPGWSLCTGLLDKPLLFTVSLSSQVYRWIPTNLSLEVTLGCVGSPSGVN